MAELFRLKISVEYKISLPQRLVSRLRLQAGDEIELVIGDDNGLTVASMKKRGSPEPSEEKLRELERREWARAAEVIAHATVALDGKENALAWLNRPHAQLGNETPLFVALHGDREEVDRVNELLSALENGIHV